MNKRYDKCDLCGCGRAAPRHKRASMQSFHEFEGAAADPCAS